MKNTALNYCLLLLFISGSFGIVCGQKFEGNIIYNIHYVPKSKLVKAKDIQLMIGNKEIVSIKNEFYKSERYHDTDLLKTYLYNNSTGINYIKPGTEDYWIQNKVGDDIAKKINKVDTTAIIGNYTCDVYRYTKTVTNVTFYIAREKYAGKNMDNNWYAFPTSFNGPVVKLVIDYPDYVFIQEAASFEPKILDDSVFTTKNDLIVLPMSVISTQVLDSGLRKELYQCMLKKIGYPNYLSLLNTEGKIWIVLLVDQTGRLTRTSVKIEYFKKAEESIRIYNNRKIIRLERKTQHKILPKVQYCLRGITFSPPYSGEEKVNTLIQIPFIFSKYFAETEPENIDLEEVEYDDVYYDDYDEFY